MRCRLVAARRLARSDAHRLAHAHCLARSTNARRVTTYVRPAEGGDVYLVGTAHVGTRSRDEVANIVDTVRPATVVVELCRPRAEALRNGAGESQSSIGPTLERLGLDAATARIAAGVFDRFAGSVTQGGDMLAAIDAAERVGAEERGARGRRELERGVRRLERVVVPPELEEMYDKCEEAMAAYQDSRKKMNDSRSREDSFQQLH